MSCITQILTKTENKPYLIDPRNSGDGLVVEGGGEYKGYEYLITFTDMGHRCGYVAIPSHHKVNDTKKVKYDFHKHEVIDIYEVNIDCHGGITFADSKHYAKQHFGITCNDLWIGFDCAHSFDGKDFESLKKYYGENAKMLKYYNEYLQPKREFELVKNFQYVEDECKVIIDQLIELDKAA